MKDASRILYTIGKIFNIIGLVVSLLCLILPIMILANSQLFFDQQKASAGNRMTLAQIQVLGVILLVVLIIGIVFEIVALLLAIHASKKLNNNTKEVAPHVIMIIVGILCSIFYLIGGILGLVAEEEQKELN